MDLRQQIATEESLKLRAKRLVSDTFSEKWTTMTMGARTEYVMSDFRMAYNEGCKDECAIWTRRQEMPWEYLVLYAASNTQETMNEASAQGWEFLCPFDGSKVLFRRRKAVSNGQET